MYCNLQHRYPSVGKNVTNKIMTFNFISNQVFTIGYFMNIMNLGNIIYPLVQKNHG